MSRPLVALRCDAGANTGIGHLMRCLALAEGLSQVGVGAVVVGTVDEVPLARRLLAHHGLMAYAAPTASLVPILEDLGASALVVDSYEVPAVTYAQVRATGCPVVAVVDAPAPKLEADLLVNPNYASEPSMAVPHRGRVLAGVSYALLRSSVTHRRPLAPPGAPKGARRVLVVLGGTDVLLAAVTVAERLLATGLALEVDVVCSTPHMRKMVGQLTSQPGQRVTALGPVDDLAALAVEADLVVSAAGTTVWELACLGRPMALVPVVDNQIRGYSAVVSAGLAVGLGPAERLNSAPQKITAILAQLLGDRSRRASLSAAGYALVDGRGRERLAAEIKALLGAGGNVVPTARGDNL